MADWVMPAALARPMPRKVSMNGCSGGLLILFAMMAGMIVSLILAIAVASSHKISILERRGVEITGKVISRHIVEGKTNNHAYFIDYRFEPPELSHQAVSFEGDDVEVSAAQYYSVRVSGPIDVIYDPKKPDRSMLLASFNLAKAHSTWPVVWIASAAIGGPILVIGGLYGFSYRREEYVLQWGKAAPAKIIAEHQVKTRSGLIAKVSYSFEDDHGVTRRKTISLPVSNDPRPGFAEERARYLNNPTAVFDPRNSKRNVLFPGTLLQLN